MYLKESRNWAEPCPGSLLGRFEYWIPVSFHFLLWLSIRSRKKRFKLFEKDIYHYLIFQGRLVWQYLLNFCVRRNGWTHRHVSKANAVWWVQMWRRRQIWRPRRLWEEFVSERQQSPALETDGGGHKQWLRLPGVGWHGAQSWDAIMTVDYRNKCIFNYTIMYFSVYFNDVSRRLIDCIRTTIDSSTSNCPRDCNGGLWQPRWRCEEDSANAIIDLLML